MNRIRTILFAIAIALLASAVCLADEVFPVVHREPIVVRLLDGKSGKPQARVHVILTAGYDRRDLALGMWREEVVTDAEGKVRLSDTLRNLPLLRVDILQRHACSTGTANAAISVELVRRDGLSGANRCGFAPADNAPGVLTLFVRGKNSKDGHPLADPKTDDSAKLAKSQTPPKEPAPEPPLTEFEIAQLPAELN